MQTKKNLFWNTAKGCLLSAKLLLMTSCSMSYISSNPTEYTTTIPAEPIFTSHPRDTAKLGEAGEKYLKRDGGLLEDRSHYKPKEDETYHSYKSRLFNTLSLQDYELQQLQRALEHKQDALVDLKQQLLVLQEKQVGLRLAIASLSPEQSQTTFSNSLFARYQIQPGDTLQKISSNKFNTYRAWLAIYRFNFEKLPNGPNRIQPGTWIVIPKINLERDLLLHRQFLDNKN
ncbi:MAG: hypothetical protein K0S74_138 [Chlamydiales bacterium]|nr:hypothetical protein [Chlamydiales bacterium]